MERFNNECNDFNCGDDFYSYVNSNWITNTEIPEDYQRWGVFQILQDFTVKKIKKILDKAYKSSNSDYKKLFTIYSQYFNYDKRADPSNILYIQNIFSKINSCVTSSELFDLMFKYDLLFTISFPINIVIQSNLKNADEVILHIGSGGIGLPDRDYYFIESKENVRNKYKDFIKKYSELFGLLVDPDTIFNLEKKLAEKTLTKVQKRIPELSDNLSNWNDLIVNTPNLSFIKEIFIKSGKKPDKVNILNLEYIQFINDFIPSYNLGNWKQYFCFKIMLTFNNCLSEQIEKTYFDFYNGVILGVEKMKPLWKRSIEFTEKLLGELLGKFYVENYFNSKSKTKASEIFKYIKKELENIIKNSDWMNKETKIKAIEKLNKMNIKIGYPDKYEKDYEQIDISDKNSLLINSINIRSHDINYKIQKLYRPVDRNQ